MAFRFQKFAFISGLYCHNYTKPLDTLGSTTFVGKHFGPGATIQYPNVEAKLLSIKKPTKACLRIDVLYFLNSVIVGKGKT